MVRIGRAATAPAVVIVVVTLMIAVAVLIGRDWLFGVGPMAVHDLAVAKPVVSVCGRSYEGGTTIRSLDAIRQRGGPVVLVDPAPFAPCPPPNSDGGKPCSNVADGPCATVVYVRIAADAYAEYALAGGP